MMAWVVTNGMYGDEQVIGIATSADQADAMTVKAELSGKFSDHEYRVHGPFEPGEIFDDFGRKVEI